MKKCFDRQFCEFLANMQSEIPELQPTIDDVVKKFQEYFSK